MSLLFQFKSKSSLFQCFVRNEQESAQATAELKLGGRFDPPEFTKTFQSQVLKSGPSVEMPCIAKGDPTPDITWYLYDTVIESDPSSGVTIGSFTGAGDEIVSYLNITQARTKHGGLYKCVATSKVGSVTHVGRLDVHGAPYVRPMENMKVVAGKTMMVTCPVAGYPISKIVWEREGRQLPINDRQRVFDNGTLIIEDVQRSEDAAAYTCVAKNEGGYSGRSDLEVSVMGKYIFFISWVLLNFLAIVFVLYKYHSSNFFKTLFYSNILSDIMTNFGLATVDSEKICP